MNFLLFEKHLLKTTVSSLLSYYWAVLKIKLQFLTSFYLFMFIVKTHGIGARDQSVKKTYQIHTILLEHGWSFLTSGNKYTENMKLYCFLIRFIRTFPVVLGAVYEKQLNAKSKWNPGSDPTVVCCVCRRIVCLCPMMSNITTDDCNPHLYRQTLCSHLSERKARLMHTHKSALIPDCIIPLHVDEIWDDLLLFHHGLLLYSEMWRKSAKHQGLSG